jgi:mono/diheme cytochrome c family protein
MFAVQNMRRAFLLARPAIDRRIGAENGRIAQEKHCWFDKDAPKPRISLSASLRWRGRQRPAVQAPPEQVCRAGRPSPWPFSWKATMKRLLLAAILAAPTAAAASMSPGEYLTRAADCVACHTAPGATPYAGGRAFALPVGTIYSPNLTPDKQTGIGNYTDDEWVAAVQQGIGPGGRHLYPAMPYTSYTLMSRQDALAIKSYLMTLQPVHAAPPANKLGFPFNQRWTLSVWNLANSKDARFQPDTSKSADWNRGAYLVEALGHCEQCHTPRNWMLGLKSGRAMAGALQVGWMAYNISNDRDHGIGAWSDSDLAQYLSTGYAPGHGPASGPMAEAISNSLRFLTPQDIHAMVTYLRSVPAQSDGTAAVTASTKPAAANPLGEHVFTLACAGCHLPDGQGRQSPWAALAGDQSAGDPSGTNALAILTQGSELQTGTGQVFMHSFVGGYTDEEMAAVTNYVISQFGGRDGHVTPEDVKRAKASGAKADQSNAKSF